MASSSGDFTGLNHHVSVLEASSPEALAPYAERLAALIQKARPAAAGALADPSASAEVVAEDPLARFKTQYDALPKGNILAQGSTWEQVQTRLSDPANADKLRKVVKEMDDPRLYAVMEDGSLEFTDGNPDTPPMFVKDNKTGAMRIIFKRDPEQMDAAHAQIEAKTHQWASVQEMLDWAKTNGFDVFSADTKDNRCFGKEMKLAEAASPHGLFVGRSGGSWMATVLKDARYAYFNSVNGFVDVNPPYPGDRSVDLGLLRQLRI